MIIRKDIELGSLSKKHGSISDIDENPTVHSTKCYILQININYSAD